MPKYHKKRHEKEPHLLSSGVESSVDRGEEREKGSGEISMDNVREGQAREFLAELS